MTDIIRGYLFAWAKNRDYAQSLVADLSDAQMVAQPASDPEAPSNHPAWVLSHLNVYLPVICAIIKGETFADPKDHAFGMLSRPEASSDTYASKEELMGEFVSGHDEVERLLGAADDSVFSQDIQLERWVQFMPTSGIALPYLMLNHENNHLGQVSAWRRIQGMPSV